MVRAGLLLIIRRINSV